MHILSKNEPFQDLECIFPSGFDVFTKDVEHNRRATARNRRDCHEWEENNFAC